MSFLMGLNDTYAAVRGYILLMDPIPSLSKIFSLLLEDEKAKKVGARKRVEIDTAVALAAKSSNAYAKNSTKSKSRRPECTHCGTMGHVVDKCYKLHGYPLDYKFKTKGQSAGSSSSFANNVVAIEDSSSEAVNLTCAKYHQLIGLLNSQCHFGTQAPLKVAADTHQVANIFTQPSLGLQGYELSGIWSSPSLEYSVFSSTVNTSHISSTDWILDSGATNYMVQSLHFLKTITSSIEKHGQSYSHKNCTSVCHLNFGECALYPHFLF